MMYAKAPHRLGTTAIAAVIALTATPLFAQSADAPPADTATPVLITPAPVETPTPAASAPAALAMTNGVVTAPVVMGSGSGANLAQTPRIVIDDKPDASPAAAKPTTAQAPSATRAAPAARMTGPAASRIAAAPQPAPAPAKPAIVAPPAAAVDEPAAPAARPAAPPEQENDILPIAGIAGVGALALIGGALAMRRRKRDDEDVFYEEAEFVPEPIIAAPAATAPVYARDLRQLPAQAESNTLPSGFDISRFGRHVQAAYRGPTADNPSLSLKTRLKRASFFDQRERLAAMPRQVQPDVPPVATTMDRAQPIPRRPDPIASRPTRQPTFRPAFQS